MADKMSQLHSRQLLTGRLPTKAPTHSSRLYQKGEENEKGSEGHIATYIEDDPRDVLFTTNTPSAHSSKASGNFIILAITNAAH